MRVVLKKRWSTHNNLRTDRVYGEALNLPEVGQPFTLYAEPLEIKDEAATRVIHTTPVIHVQELDENNHRFYTSNSVYELEVVPSPNEEGPRAA